MEDDDIGAAFVVSRSITGFLKHRGDLGAVGFVHLAADGPEEEALAVGRGGAGAGRRVEGHGKRGHGSLLAGCRRFDPDRTSTAMNGHADAWLVAAAGTTASNHTTADGLLVTAP